ncbi:methyltransferase domain-containing protein [Scytonema sp. UIC 10036]|uniref:class I SAM-dependent methyltransferase n=1 Tax=Scytonema sp. UIC 10036 TaxID=2304196 RepID=UPI0012DA3179|nr:class I SAM-dependent methyltransferase [Scytonema sp. UIC 10036]MUG98651.1 methyltransferase domain-containing protein [Scytonema sp. UIC 10036]
MEFTGERYVPSLEGEIKYEHLHRYALCIEFITGKTVLDIASGEGYGSALLAKYAQSVTGVDISCEAVDYAAHQYSNSHNLKFMVGSCDSIPLLDNSIEVVTSFETIEHHDKHEEMILEIKRVLKPEGILIISSPNRLTYSDEPNYKNPFHIKELYYEEFISLLNQHFKYVQIYGQKLAVGSFIFSPENEKQSSFKAYTGTINDISNRVCALKSPLYFVAVCSDGQSVTKQSIDSIYIDGSDDILKRYYTELQKLHTERQQFLASLEQMQRQVQQTQAELEQSQLQVQQTQAELEQSQLQVQQTQAELEQSQLQVQQTQAELEQSQLQVQQTQTALAQSQLQVQQTQAELEQSQLQVQQTQAELEQSQLQVQQTQTALAQSQLQVQQTQAELEQSQLQVQQTQAELEQSQLQVQQTQTALAQTSSELKVIKAELENLQFDLPQNHIHLQQARDRITAMESSKFWKMRKAWFNLKRALRIKADE